MISETEKQDFIDREARLSTNLVRLILHEFSLPYPRLRTRTPETAHSHARDCALTHPRLRTHTPETAHSHGHIDKSRLHTSKTHTLHTSKTHIPNTRQAPARHTSRANIFMIDYHQDITYSKTPHAQAPARYGHNEKTAPPHTRERGYQVLIESLVFMLPQQQVLLPQRQVLQQLQPLEPQPLELTCASGGCE